MGKKQIVNCPFNNCYYYHEEVDTVDNTEYITIYCTYPYDDFINGFIGRDCPHFKPDIEKMRRMKK